MQKLFAVCILVLLLIPVRVFAETADCTRFLGTWDISIGETRETWTFLPSLLQTEQMVFGENDNSSQIIVSWVDQLAAYVATNTSSYDNYYLQFDNDTRFSGYHFLDNTLLIVGTLPQEDGSSSACPARMVLGRNTAGLNLLRNYRDSVLAESPGGKLLIHFYYRMGPSACRALEDNPRLMKIYQNFLTSVLK